MQDELSSIVALVRDFAGAETALSLVIGVIVGLLAYHAAVKLTRRRALPISTSSVERKFRNVYAIMDEGRRQSLIRYYMEKYECSRQDAMRRAVEDRERDTNRW